MSEEPDWIGMFAPGGGGRCQDTVAGWLWYCDEHDSHGNADSEEEAWAVAQGHVDFFAVVTEDAEDDDEYEGECVIYVWKVEPRAGA